MPSTCRSTWRISTLSVEGHADLLKKLLAAILNEVGKVRRGLASGQRFVKRRQPAREPIKSRETVKRHRFQASVLALLFGRLPGRLAFTGQGNVVVGTQQNQMIDNGGIDHLHR